MTRTRTRGRHRTDKARQDLRGGPCHRPGGPTPDFFVKAAGHSPVVRALNAALGYVPRVPLDAGLPPTLKWYWDHESMAPAA